ncbi:MAG: aldose 1-epimerase [Candidatus Woesearchaeota archaeon]
MRVQQEILISPNKNLKAIIEGGELISFNFLGEELIHDKKKGWNNSDTEMFPIVGPTEKTNFKITTPKGEAILDQHGIARLINFQRTHKTRQKIRYSKFYNAYSNLQNPKASPNKLNPQIVFWPYDFEIIKTLDISNEKLTIEFIIKCDTTMPYMFGYHPAFKLSGKKEEFIYLDKKLNLYYGEVEEQGNFAYQVNNLSTVQLIRKDRNLNIEIKTYGFENMMFWTNDSSMICIEPITHPPFTRTQSYFEKRILGPQKFKVEIIPKKFQE